MGDAAKKVLEPGLYLRGQVDYDAIDGVNYSTLKHIAKSPLQYQHALCRGFPDTPSKFRGTAAHVAVLEPSRFVKEFAVFDGPRRAGKAWEAFQAENAGRTILKEDEFETAMKIRDAVRSHPVAARYLRKGITEAALVWDDPETGVRCKGRPDFITDDHVIVDLKSTRDITPWSFGRDAYNMAYHVQAAFYSDGYEQVAKFQDVRAVIIAVEQRAPHDVVVYTLDDEVIGIGRDAYRGMLARLVECEKARDWPGYSPVEVPLKLPAYAMPDESDLDALGLEM